MTPEVLQLTDLDSFLELQRQIEGDLFLYEQIGQDGTDSEVYKSPDGELVFKVYHYLKMGQVIVYKEITEKARLEAQNKKWKINVPGYGEIDVKILPIEFVYFSEKHNCPVAFSRYVPGENCKDGSDWSKHEDIKSFDQELNRLTNRVKVTTKNEDIFIIPLNVKVVGNRESGHELVVTDLCTNIDEATSIKIPFDLGII